jgi:nucleoside-diphosphate-sugar epimerase
MKKKILITGGAGFIGFAITNFFYSKNNIDIIVTDNNFRGSLKKFKNYKKNFKFFNCDIRDYKKLLKISKKCDTIVHLAYINGTENFYKYPTDVLDVGIKGLMNVIDVCIKNNIKELYLASSSEVYQVPEHVPTKENVELKIPDIYNPRYSYSGGKILTELVGVHYGKKFFNKLVIFRPHNVYGPDMGNEHVIPQFIRKIFKLNSNNNNLKIQGNGSEIRSFIFIDDFVDAFEKIYMKGKHLEIYNIGTETQTSINKLIKILAELMNKKNIHIVRKPIMKGSTPIRCPDITKIKNLGFKPKFNLNLGLKKTIEDFRNKNE